MSILGALGNLGVRAVGRRRPTARAYSRRRSQTNWPGFQAAGELDRVKAIYVTSYYDNPAGRDHPAAAVPGWWRSPSGGRAGGEST